MGALFPGPNAIKKKKLPPALSGKKFRLRPIMSALVGQRNTRPGGGGEVPRVENTPLDSPEAEAAAPLPPEDAGPEPGGDPAALARKQTAERERERLRARYQRERAHVTNVRQQCDALQQELQSKKEVRPSIECG